jgi:hypothetical protein
VSVFCDALYRVDNNNAVRYNYYYYCFTGHHHAADALNHMGLKPNSMLGVWWYLLLHGKYTSNAAVVQTWAPFLVIVAIIVVLSLMWL